LALGAGVGTSLSSRTSGAPYLSLTNAFMPPTELAAHEGVQYTARGSKGRPGASRVAVGLQQ
jgi:hypothetical protein